ncbi:MAG: diguanylate cyclase [Candidatus Thiodiazotropha sp. (ex Lucina aurantia)]|nr:diguanylate cyclase [Candidatus Thiodiazotropha sp. (ex Lucina pensylvanica)]MBT3025207.1 diguanylate cyclase [Candidatus Thiodiazotropha taylori]MBV2100700.1 diguanylate cyclase [Candidatus Thiodiazotropha sp. (ex Codakia orbicularis)]MBV2104919.1 diguanylate cyclase [Candidatus Thiodiazotropha sp. (ex Lucina aurantia)]MBV2119552.1 diguanylate cyclase [Candidatus Thiodiazotropha sp. (ex Lucina aurantia)]
MMFRISPTIKITIGLVMLTLSILLLGRLIGIVPDEDKTALQARKQFCESLAVQVSSAASKNDLEILRATLDTVVERNDDVLSVSLSNNRGVSLISGDHEKHWVNVPLDKSTSTHVRVPIMANESRWGTLEVAFTPLNSEYDLSLGTLGGLLLFVALMGFVLYMIFIKRTLRELDPKAVIPERVRSAFNALSEGLIILDEKDQIILANDSFTEKVNIEEDALIGRRADELAWRKREKGIRADVFPWRTSMQNMERKTGIPMHLQLTNKNERTFSVNTAPIFDGKGRPRGVLATFDDMTDLEKKHRELQSTLEKLRTSEKALRDKTVELELLATRDPLTGCYNRRAFFEKYDALFESAVKEGTGLVFMMIDIDNFKSINDQYGHANGDKVIKFIAETLIVNSRPEDVVGRYGGEEFSLVMPHADQEEAMVLAERLRNEIQQKGHDLFTDKRTVTASFGLALRVKDTDDPMLLINNADDALYLAKEQGRNRVIAWDPDLTDQERAREKAERDNEELSVSLTDGQAEKILRGELHRLEDVVRNLESELEYSRDEIKRREGKDELTGLPNKFIFSDRILQVLARCKRYEKSAALVSIDIDDFSSINEAFGFTNGDRILKVISARLVDTLRITDTVAVIDEQNDKESSTISRVNNDEFALILTDVTDIESITWVVRRILQGLKKPIEINDQELFVSFSVGIALYPHDDDTPAGLMQKASSARFAAKREQGSNHIHFFSPDINRDAYHKVWLESQLHKAIVRSHFELVYQPKFDLKSGRIVCMEALARWPHAKVGLIPPSEFIPVAESTGLIHKLGIWVLRQAIMDLKHWHDAGYTDLRIAVNLSAVQLRKTKLTQKVLESCEQTGIDPSFVELEITESALVENYNQTTPVMQAMSEAGIHFTLDDFGKGFSSLSYLRVLPIEAIKIDHSFIEETLPTEYDQTIINGIISLARGLRLKVTAEGVETENQKMVLTRLGCDEVQGTLYCEPVSSEQALSLLQTYNKTGAGE